jgi:3-hydroxyacyl-[acyl-carrier-protein] dehydratase
MMAQVCCAFLVDKSVGKTPYFTGLNNVRFKSPVLPGDTLEIECQIIKEKQPFYFAEGKGKVKGKLSVSGEFSFALID